MDSSIQIYNSKDFYVRSLREDGEIWFVGKDILVALEYSETSTPGALMQSVPEIWKGIKRIDSRSENGVLQSREMLCLTEQGLYFFLGRSDKEKALPYQKWIAGEVVPSIRKAGVYAVNMSHEEIELKSKELEIRDKEVNLRRAEVIRGMLDNPPFPITAETRTVFAHEVYRLTSGYECLAMLPECTEKWYTAADIGSVLGISAQKVGRIANKYGRWIMSKSKYSAREVPSFIYTCDGLEWFMKHEEMSKV